MVPAHREIAEEPRKFGLGLGVVIETVSDTIRPGSFGIAIPAGT